MSLDNKPSYIESQDTKSTIHPNEAIYLAEKQQQLISLIKTGRSLDYFISTIDPKQWEDLLLSPDVQTVAQHSLIKCLSGGYNDDSGDIDRLGYIYDAKKIITTFKLPDNIIQTATKPKLIYFLSSGDVFATLSIINTFKLPDVFLQSPDIQTAAEKNMTNCLSHGYIGDAKKIITTFKLPEDIVQTAAQQGLIKCLSEGNTYNAQSMITTVSNHLTR